MSAIDERQKMNAMDEKITEWATERYLAKMTTLSERYDAIAEKIFCLERELCEIATEIEAIEEKIENVETWAPIDWAWAERNE